MAAAEASSEEGVSAGEYDENTLSRQFDEVFNLFREVNDFEGETTSKSFQSKVDRGITTCEKLTLAVSVIDMFSSNETIEELASNHIKFLLLPFLLGKFWQWKTDKDRKEICEASEIYFRDFLQRLYDYQILTILPEVLEKDEDKKRRGSSASIHDVRAKKIALLKENKALESRIKAIFDKQNANEEIDDDTIRDLYLTIIQRSKNEAVSELESIVKEMELIKYSMKMQEEKERGGGDESKSASKAVPPKKSGIQTFILTRNEVEKQVFGMGYPALPVMTVEELYAQRRAEGTWGPPPGPATIRPSEEESAEAEAEVKDLQEETDDPVRLEQLRNLDEYKDMHRRGWGNRMNRS